MDQTLPPSNLLVETTAAHDEQLVPGKLRGEVTLTLQTQQAARLVRGRAHTAEKPAIIGLLSFAALCRTIGHGAYGDDPYAYWWEQKIDSALTDAHAVIDGEAGRLDALIAPDCGLTVAPACSEKPARIALNFTNADAYRAAYLIACYDQLVCRALTMAHTGQVPRQAAVQAINTGGRAVRRVLQTAMGYRFFGLERIDVLEQNERAVAAREAMGECPESLLERLESELVIVKKAGSAADSHETDPSSVAPEPSMEIETAEGCYMRDVEQESASHVKP
ncbi:PFL_4669 family integrating conjugative element protein [Congregibacter litoralis]|uniref:Integrating conjugative element protein family n=1 Tax=Congregibacter litoralis KT71 TaxID=314285 RepID=A4AE84_9GAMM|nr:TIGR03761 family integrating conjugative element protein [Congregibacter litoralis]EAQ95671.1 integrating conjugative element protein family [Congregibacter litoralis KT71]